MELEQMYEASASEKVKHFESDLRTELADLKTELEENEMVHGIPTKFSVSSVPLPSSVEHFRLERKLIIKRAMQVSEAQPVRIQADVMKDEMMDTETHEYTPQSLPLLLHQYFTERVQQLIQCKHLHMLRWKRFCEHTSTIESLYPLYQKKLAHILSEYHDCLQRAQRLSVARESLLEHKDTPLTAIKMEDMHIYLRWLICNLHSLKHFNQYLKVLQWLPISHQTEIAPPDFEKAEQEEITNASKMASRYDDGMGLFATNRPRSGAASRPNSAASTRSISTPVPAPPPINLTLLSTNPLPSSAMLYAAAASGGGLASDEHNLCLPRHTTTFESLKPHLAFLVNIYGIQFDLDNIHSSADEMELFAAINRKFKHIFIKQEHMRTFKMYDRIETGQDGWGSDSPNHALLKDSNWSKFITLKPKREAEQEKRRTQLRQSNNVDDVLRVKAHFLHVADAEGVQDTLRQHAAAVREPPFVVAASVTSHRTQNNTSRVWKKIYANPDLYSDPSQQDPGSPQDFDERNIEDVNFSGNQSRASSARKRKDSYDYVNTVQMLGLDEGERDQNASGNIQGAYLSFLQLRHLRLRDLRRSCLSIMNYFHSIERTLTINDGGLSHESGTLKRQSQQNHRRGTETEGTVGGGGGLGSHSYLHNTPADFKIGESEFMEYSEVENHDDFYTVEEGRIHVVDQRGYYVMYHSALSDIEAMEKDMMLIATHFIEKDRDLRVSRVKFNQGRRSAEESAGDFDIESYAHQELDRFGVMLDLWTNEAAFLECKRELLDCYFEAYQHVFDRDEKRALAQVITDIMYQRPRFDYTAPYFVKTYRAECVLLRQQATLVKTILDKQIEEQREYVQRVCRDGDVEFGLPHSIIPKQPVSINLSRPALKNVFMLEFHPTLSIASRIPQALEHALKELLHVHRPESVFDQLLMEKKLLEVAQREWDKLDVMGASYSSQIQKDLFTDVYCDDPQYMCAIVQKLVSQQDQEGGSRRSTKEKQSGMVSVFCRLMETVTLRYRLMDASWETEILTKMYRQQAAEMNFPDCHLFLRPIQFEFASFKPDANKPPPIFITAVQGDESSIERYTPQNNVIFLAIHELEETQVGHFSYRSREGVIQILRPGGVENIQVVLKAQVVHKNALIAAVQQANVCQPRKHHDYRSGRASPTETKSEKSSMTQFTGISSGTGGTGLVSKHQSESNKHRRSPEAFVSLQLEKRPSRDTMLNDFILKKQQMGSVLRNMDEQEKLKRRLISEYCTSFNHRVIQYSLRGQLIAYYHSIHKLLEDFPTVRDTYFMWGEVNEKKTEHDDLMGLKADPKVMNKRPRRLLSPNGRDVLNIWFVPHHSEVLIMFKTLDDVECVRALHYTVAIVAALHDMLQYLCAHSRLGSSHARLGSQKMEFVSADWGGTEGIGAELREIQKQINNLPNPTNPDSVVEFLCLRRDVMFLEFDTAVRHYMTDTFLSTGNLQGYKAILDNMYHSLPALSNVQQTSLYSTYLTVPEPLEPRDFEARRLFPWRSFICQNGPYPHMFWQWHQIEHNIQSCLAGLKEVDRHVANGEILGVTLLMEDVLQTGNQDTHLALEGADDADAKSITESADSHRTGGGGTESRRGTITTIAKIQTQSLSRTQQPMEAYKLLKSFLKLCKCLELAKVEWGRRKLMVEKIDNTHIFREYCKTYRQEVLLPVLQSVARRLGQGDLYEGLVLDTDTLVMPRGASEIEVRAKQLVRLFENLECHMIMEVQKRVAKESSLALSERAREEGALPTDLWKKPAMKESYTMARPHVAEDFTLQLMSQCDESEDSVTFRKEHLYATLSQLARDVMGREKVAFESYSMYYENLLRVNHQLLYQREQENKQLQDQLKQSQHSANVDVQCQLATQAHDMLMEITALRAKVAEMRGMMMSQQRDLQEETRKCYEGLVQDMFNCIFQLRGKLDEYKDVLYDDVHAKIAETRQEAMIAMSKLERKVGGGGDDDKLTTNLSQSDKMRELQHENHTLSNLVLKMKTMTSWRQNHSTNNFLKTIGRLKSHADNSKKEYLEIRMLAEEEVILLRQQLVAVKKALSDADRESEDIKKQLDKELKMKLEKQHELIQRERSKRQLEQAKQANIEKLLDELEDKDTRLRYLSEEQERSMRMQAMSHDKVRKDVTAIKKQLTHERNLKLDAFQRVDELQATVYDYETVNRSQSSTALQAPIPSPKYKSRAMSAGVAGRRATTPAGRGPGSAGGQWPPQITWPGGRSLTPLGDNLLNNNDYKKMARPKTVGGRLRSRIAEQLLNEFEPDHHQTIVHLEELQLGDSKP